MLSLVLRGRFQAGHGFFELAALGIREWSVSVYHHEQRCLAFECSPRLDWVVLGRLVKPLLISEFVLAECSKFGGLRLAGQE